MSDLSEKLAAIPEEAVVAATKALFADNISNHAGDNAPQIIDVCEKVARRALEAANLPLLALVRDQAAKLAKVEVIERRLESSMQGEDREIAEDLRAAMVDKA